MQNSEPRFYRAEQVRALDRAAIERMPISGFDLMQRAAAAAWRLARRQWPRAQSVRVYCGAGNNGGDGYLFAHLAREAGWQVELLAPCGAAHGGDAQRASAVWAGPVIADGAMRTDAVPDLVVDGLLGTGLNRPVSTEVAAAIGDIAGARDAGAGVLALDIPSGVNADTGAPMGAAVVSDHTISFVARKLGLYTGTGPDYGGQRWFDDLGVPLDIAPEIVEAASGLGATLIAGELRSRRASAHKGNSGRVLVIGGAPGMAGAALLACRAALRGGAGLVHLATHPDHAASCAGAQPEIMIQAVSEAGELRPLLAIADAVVIGPGMGQAAWGRSMWSACLESQLPTVVDADALNLLAVEPLAKPNWVLTPHPGEAARLLAASTRQVQADRVTASRKLVEQYGGVAVLKGAGTIVCGESIALCPHGNAGMAVGGMGDVLAGLIGAILAQGLRPERAAGVGVAAHALAADRHPHAGRRGLLPLDVIEQLPEVLAAPLETMR